MKDRRIRVMHAIIGSGFGGLEKVAMNIIGGLDPDFYDRYLLCLSSPTLLGEEYDSTSAKLVILNYGRGKHYGLPMKVHEVVKKNRIDILHMHDFNPFFYCTLGTLISKSVKRVYTEHSGIYASKKRHLKCVRIFSGLTDAMVMVSRDLKRYYEDRLGVKPNKLQVIYNGIDFKEPSNSFDPEGVRKSIEVGRDDVIIGTTGRLIEQKGLRYLIDAAPAIAMEIPSVKFVVVGDGRLRGTLESMVRDMKLTNHFRFLGYRKNIHELLSIFDVYALPSLWEGLPLGILEAMFCRRSIVASRVGGVPEILGENERGLLVEPGNSGELARELIKLLKDERMRTEIERKSFDYVKENFTVEKMVQNYDLLYRTLIARK